MLELLYTDQSLAVCVKPAGILSEEPGMPALLREQLGGGAYCIHRLDRAVGGVMVYARTRQAAAALSNAVSQRQMQKEYLAVCRGLPSPSAGTMEDLLFKDSGKNKAFVVKRERKGVRPARLAYETLDTVQDPDGPSSLVRIRLETGRFHQIRVQFASRGMPLLGDRKYGGPEGAGIALWSWRLSFPHPETGKNCTFSALPTGEPWNQFVPQSYLTE